MKLSLTTQAGLLAGSRATAQVLNALAGIIVVRFLSQDDYGTFRQVYLLFATLVLFTDLGLGESLFYFIPRQPARRAALMRRSTLIVGVLQILVGAVLVQQGAQLGRFFNNADLPAYLGLLAVYLGASAVTRLWEVQLISEQRAPLAAVVMSGFEALKVALMLVSLAVSPGVWLLVWALAASAVTKLVCYIAFLLYDAPRPTTESPLVSGAAPAGWRSGLGAQFSYALALWAPGLLNTLGLFAHQYVVGYFFAPSQYAIYSVACFQIPLLGVLGMSIGEVLLVRATEYSSQQRTAETAQLWNNACRKALLVYVPAATALAVLSAPLITLLFTERYRASVPLFAIMVLALPFGALIPEAVLRAYAAMRAYTFFYILRIALAIGLSVLGVKLLGLWGAAISTVVAIALVRAVQVWWVSRLLQVGPRGALPWAGIGRIVLVSLVAAAPAAACAAWLAQPVAALAAGLTLYGVVFLAGALKLDLVTRDEIHKLLAELNSTFGRWVGRVNVARHSLGEN